MPKMEGLYRNEDQGEGKGSPKAGDVWDRFEVRRTERNTGIE